MPIETLIFAFALFMLIATLYSSIGHAGASGYLAIMALLSFAPEAIKPTSLILNIIVASIASYRFIRAGYFDGRVFAAFAISALPMAFIGGYTTLSTPIFKTIAGLFLITSAVLLLLRPILSKNSIAIRPIIWPLTLAVGAAIGLLSGLIGVGGGIFLSPIIILAGWATVKKTSGIAALFILVNSIAGLTGHLSSVKNIQPSIAYWVIAVAIGGLVGSHLGTRTFNSRAILAFLFVVLLSAGIKFLVA